MRLALSILMLFGVVGLASPADPPAPKERTKQDTLKQLEGVWVLKSVTVATPQGVGMVDIDAPNIPVQGITIKDGYQIMTRNGKPISSKHPQLKLGPEPECLLVCGPPEKKPFKIRFRIETDKLIIVQDMLFPDDCPESFDPQKGRFRDRRILTFTREPQKLSGLVGRASPAEPPAPKERAKQDTLKQLEGVWILKSAVVATPEGVGMAKLDGPKLGLTFQDGYQIMTKDGKPIANGRSPIEQGSEAGCLHMTGKPNQKPFKVRFKLEGDTLVIVQDMLFQQECPESFDPEKGRDRGRRILTFTREPQTP